MKTVISLVPPGKQGADLVAVSLAVTDATTGQSVELTFAGKSMGQHKVSKVRTKTLGSITYKDLVGFVHADPLLFWQRIERTLGTGLPAETKVKFVTLSADWEAEEVVEALQEELEPEPEPNPKWSRIPNEEFDY